MSDAVIELNDSALTVVQAGEVVAGSPGVAVLKQDRIDVGQAALRAARIDPRNTFSRFWSNLSQDSFKHGARLARHNADLAFAHLLALSRAADGVSEVVCAAPGSFTTEQLSLLLGLLEASPFTAAGLVDAAVAATAATAGAGNYNHLDIHLHHTVITSLEVGGAVKRTAVQSINDVGLLNIHDKCVNHIADLFVQQSRFDPLHQAQTEQALYNRLAQCLQELERSADTMVDLEFGNTRYQARVNRERLVETLRPLYAQIGAAIDRSAVALVNKRLADLPGFVEHLTGMDALTEVLDERAVFNGCMGHEWDDQTADEGICFVTQLKAATEPASGVVSRAPSAREARAPAPPTHILIGADAHALGPAPLYLSAQGVLSARQGQDALCSLSLQDSTAILVPAGASPTVCVNGATVVGKRELAAGDVIGGVDPAREYTLIRVL